MNLRESIEKIQSRLDFKHWQGYPQFFNDDGLARVAVLSFVLGSIFSSHALLMCFFYMDKMRIMNFGLVRILSTSRRILTFQWLQYVLALCFFHLAEFFVTAIWNPTVLGAQSFLVNHSKAYTIAMLVRTRQLFLSQ